MASANLPFSLGDEYLRKRNIYSKQIFCQMSPKQHRDNYIICGVAYYFS